MSCYIFIGMRRLEPGYNSLTEARREAFRLVKDGYDVSIHTPNVVRYMHNYDGKVWEYSRVGSVRITSDGTPSKTKERPPYE